MWILSNDSDANDRIVLQVTTRAEATEEALKRLGWNLLTDEKPNKPTPNKPTPKPKVVITVFGGVVDVETLPKGIDVEVRDYDVDGCDENRIKKDKNGISVIIMEFEG